MREALRLIVIGGGTAGMAAAARARRLSPQSAITVVERNPQASLGVCGLPYLVAGRVPSVGSLIVVSEKELREERRLDLRLCHEAVGIELQNRLVLLRDNRRGRQLELAYDRLVLAPGGRPVRPAVPGVGADNVFSFHDLNDALRLLSWLEGRACRTALVIGGGYLGVEMAECLLHRGLRVALWEKRAALLGLEASLNESLVDHLSRQGVSIRLGSALAGLEGGRTGPVQRAVSQDGEHFEADLFLLATGVEPVSPLLEGCPLRRGSSGALAVDRRAETSRAGVFAAGDCIEVEHRVSGRRTYLPLALPAARMGRVAGENSVGGSARFEGALGTVAVKVFELELARTGLDRHAAEAAGLQAQTLCVKTRTRAGYYPGSGRLTLAVTFERESRRLLGAQAVGHEGAAARVNLVAAAIEGGLTVDGLERLDLAYTPPLAPLWDATVLTGRLSAGSDSGWRN
ncbi:MAG: FAD-dependent oxidoreductase [Armatimonadetes bacterium]|nr:FAD-dependent oxidoreductase [Armatimonadota bacterium]